MFFKNRIFKMLPEAIKINPFNIAQLHITFCKYYNNYELKNPDPDPDLKHGNV
jgi:hypothetical protein